MRSSTRRCAAIAEPARRLSGRILAALLLAASAAVAASVDPSLPRYEPRAVALPAGAAYVTAQGVVTVVGYNDMREMLEPMAALFTATHPDVRFELVLPGTRFAPVALAKGESAFAPMGAELTPPQLAEYRAIRHDDPIAFRVAHASLDPRALSGPLAIFVHRDNPLASLTPEQVARAFSGEARHWGDLGLEGHWAKRPIRTYGMSAGTALAYAFEAMAMGARPIGAQMTGLPQSAEVVGKIAHDRDGIGFAAAMRATQDARVVRLASHEGDAPVELTEESIVAGRYPLDRFLLVYVARPITPLAREFLRLMLSREGQAAVAATPQRYLPLSAQDAARERNRLELLE
jgi:phosphate transport system substrate-binding protein